MKLELLLSLAVVLLSFIMALYLYFQSWVPGQMASHWGINGDVNGYLPKFWGLFLLPIIAAGCLGVFALIPRIDPLKKNVHEFAKYFDRFILIFILFLLYLYILTILWAMGNRFNMVQLMAPGFGALIFYAGILVSHAKRNWFIGIRTPWTMSSEIVWDKTHKLGGKLFKTAGLLAFVGAVIPEDAIYFVLIPILAAAIVSVVYSYFEYKKQEKK